MSMFCYQCQEAAKGTGCQIKGVCGKSEEVANLQDLLIYSIKGISEIIIKGNLDVNELSEVNHKVINGLFMTITNANFDNVAIEKEIKTIIKLRDELRNKANFASLHDAAIFEVNTKEEMEAKANIVGVLLTENEDVRSLRELITYGLKGLAAY